MSAPSASFLLDYYTHHQLAAEIGVCEKTLSRWTRIGEGPPRIKIGHTVLYRKSSVADWIASRERVAAA